MQKALFFIVVCPISSLYMPTVSEITALHSFALINRIFGKVWSAANPKVARSSNTYTF